MNNVHLKNKLRIRNKHLTQFVESTEQNLENFIKANAVRYGVACSLGIAGELTNELQATAVDDNTILISPGYIVENYNGEIMLIEVPETVVDVSGSTDGQQYIVYVVPLKSNREEGTVSLTNGSQTINITGGDFNKLSDYEWILISGSSNSNDGLYQIHSASGASGTLTESFSGTSESGLRWAVVGWYGDMTPSESDTLYEYDKFQVIVSTNPELYGYKVALFNYDSSAIQLLEDIRHLNMFEVRNFGNVSSDKVIEGKTNNITTIAEKSQAGRVDLNMSAITKGGVRSGLITTLILDRDETRLQVSTGVAYDNMGRRINVISSELNLNELVSGSKILSGNNFLYVAYKESNLWEFVWSQAVIDKPGVVLIATVNYNPLENPQFFLTDSRSSHKLKSPSLISEGHELEKVEGELFYNPTDRYYYYTKRKSDDTLETLKLIDENTVATKVQEVIDSIAKREYLRFTFYPIAGKENWFSHNGYAAPLFVPYDFKIIEMQVMAFNITDITSNQTDVDYMSKLGSNPKVVTQQGTLVNQVFVKAPPIQVNQFQSSSLGVFFSGLANPRLIELKINGVARIGVNMEGEAGLPDSGQGTPLNTLYHAVVLIEQTQLSQPITTEL